MSPPRRIAPSVIHLPAGTRIWVSLESSPAHTSGHFQFTGTLLLPVTVSNVVVLEKGTPVTGAGESSGGQTLLQITEFVSQGRRYLVRTNPAPDTLSLAGSGKVVQFQSGQVAELWLESAATYDAIAVPGVQPQRHINATAPAPKNPNSQ
jgi:hypothetical protein